MTALRVSLALSLCAMLVGSGIAEAKKKGAKPKKQGPVVSRAASSTASGNGQIATATATCPKNTRALGGGFAGTAPSGTVSAVVYESQKVGQKAWRASSQVFDFGPADPVTLTTYVYCRRGAPATKTSALVVPTAGVPQLGPAANANCAPGRKALSGGFATDPPVITSGGAKNLVTDSLRSSGGSWLSQVVSDEPSSLSSFAYCAKAKKPPAAAGGSAPPNSTFSTGSTATATCPGKRVAVAGGFSQTGIVADGPNLTIYESQGSGRDWRVSGVRTGASGVPVTLSGTAYCG